MDIWAISLKVKKLWNNIHSNLNKKCKSNSPLKSGK